MSNDKVKKLVVRISKDIDNLLDNKPRSYGLDVNISLDKFLEFYVANEIQNKPPSERWRNISYNKQMERN